MSWQEAPKIGSGTGFAVREIWRNVELPCRTWFHELQSFRPTFDDVANTKLHFVVAGFVEDRTIEQRTLVLHLDRTVGRWRLTVAISQDFVLQAAVGRNDTFLLLRAGYWRGHEEHKSNTLRFKI